MSEINKFIYLKRYLSGQALSFVSGLSLTAGNYKDALELLKGRYGNPQVLISAYMESLLKLGKVRSMEDISGLRKLASDIENCVRNLRSMDVETSTYGSLLIPLLKERLPDELVFHISRRFEDSIWTLGLLIEYMNKEIKASENCSSFFKGSTAQSDRSTAYNLGISTESAPSCVFCAKGHPSFKCRKVTNVKSRVDILRRNRKCFVCLGAGHQKRDCKARYICKNCNGRHHIAICFGKEGKEAEGKTDFGDKIDIPQNLVMSTKAEHDAILLQTATAQVQDSCEKNRAKVKLLFDSGSQRSFITGDLRARLNLETERTEKVVIKTFGEGDSNTVSKLPMTCRPENNSKMRTWLLQHYSCSTFNTCPHQPLPRMDGPPVEIHLKEGTKPKACHKAIPIPIHWQEKVYADLRRDEALGVIEPVPIGEPVSWCHRMVVARKHDGSPRRTVDLSPLNKHCERETHNAEPPFHLARRIPRNTWKTVTDAWNGYHSLPLRESDRHLTTFITPIGRWRYKRAPQGFLSSGDGYDRRFDAVLAGFLRKERIVDDTIHYDEDLEEHWWRTIDLLTLLGNAGIVLNPDKFQFAQREVSFAGFHVAADRIDPLPKYFSTIEKFPTPSSTTDIRS